MLYTEEMRQSGISPNLMQANQKMKCPRCGYEFSLFQSRAIACRGCGRASTSCEMVRCLRCDAEFPLHGPIVSTEKAQRDLSAYMNGILDNYYRQFGRSPKR